MPRNCCDEKHKRGPQSVEVFMKGKIMRTSATGTWALDSLGFESLLKQSNHGLSARTFPEKDVKRAMDWGYTNTSQQGQWREGLN